MTDDIVTRLRKQFSNEFVIDNANLVRVPTLYEEAADEIERLQMELSELESEYNKLWSKHNSLMRDRKYPLTNDYIGDL